jgi:hypothetical protein
MKDIHNEIFLSSFLKFFEVNMGKKKNIIKLNLKTLINIVDK